MANDIAQNNPPQTTPAPEVPVVVSEVPVTPLPENPNRLTDNKVVLAFFGLLLLSISVYAGVVLLQTHQQLTELAKEQKGNIAVFKFMCESVGQQDVCNSRDTSLSGYKVDFRVYEGPSDQGPIVQTITVTLNENDQGQGNTGNGSQGRSTGGDLPVGTYTVCEVAEIYNSSGERIPLEAYPRPKASGGGSSGGGPQSQYGQNCITVDLNPGEPELKFLNIAKSAPQTTPTASPTSSPTTSPQATASPSATATATGSPRTSPTSSPSATASASPVAGLRASCSLIKAYDKDWNELSAKDLEKLKEGQLVRFAVSGSATSGTFDKAKFVINDEEAPEVSSKTPSNDEYYFEYKVPNKLKSLKVNAQLHHSELGWF